MAEPTLRSVVDLVHGWYPPGTADSWDRVGLVHGDLDQPVRRILLAVDPAPVVAQEAADWDADLLLTHHPLYLKGVHGFTSQTPKGRTSLTLPAPLPAVDKLGVMVPAEDADGMRAALAGAGAGQVGDYDHASFTVAGEGRFRPLPGADPTIGSVGEAERVDEVRIEVVFPRGRRAHVVRAMLAAHPYEEPAYDVLELADPRIGTTGTGRIGDVEPTTLRAFAERVAEALPGTAHGVRVAGDLDRPVRRVALCGGAGDFLLDTVRGTDADVYVTSDLRHHPATEFLEHEGPALVDVAHWAAEWTWLPVLARRLEGALGDTVEVRVSTRSTDAWTHRL